MRSDVRDLFHYERELLPGKTLFTQPKMVRVLVQGKGDHENWTKGSHLVTISQARDVSPGLVRKALKAIDASREGES